MDEGLTYNYIVAGKKSENLFFFFFDILIIECYTFKLT